MCDNNLCIVQDTLDSALLHALNNVLDKRMLEDAVEQALVQIRTD